jgi:co-chaperonin GroES (HSP10)
MSAKHFITADTFTPIKDNVFVTDLETGPTLTRGGILIPDDNMTDRGIRDRWAKVWAIGPDVQDVEIGEWVLVKHGRWTQGIELVLKGERKTVWRIEFPDAVMLVSGDDPRNTIKVVTTKTKA